MLGQSTDAAWANANMARDPVDLASHLLTWQVKLQAFMQIPLRHEYNAAYCSTCMELPGWKSTPIHKCDRSEILYGINLMP